MMYQPDTPLTMPGAKAVLAEGLRAIETGQTRIDLARVVAADSVAVAILLAWQRAAKARGTPLVFQNTPTVLHSLAALYGVSELLSLDGGASPDQDTGRH